MCRMLFVLQTSPLPGTSELYLSVAFQPNMLLLVLAWNPVEACSLAVWCLVSIFICVCVCVVWPHLCSDRHERWKMKTDGVVFWQVLFHADLCRMWAIFKKKKKKTKCCSCVAADYTVWACCSVFLVGVVCYIEADFLDAAQIKDNCHLSTFFFLNVVDCRRCLFCSVSLCFVCTQGTNEQGNKTH